MGLDLSPLAPAPESAPGPGSAPHAPADDRRVTPGAVLAWASVGPALVVAGWLLAAYPLALAGRATPLLAVPAAAAVVALLLAAARRLPPVPRTPWWPVLATLATAAAFAAHTAAHASGHLVLRRDSAVYALLARWLADSGGLAVPARFDTVGGPDPVLTAAAPGLYEAGDSLSAQFMSGTALTLAPAGWAGGWGAILSVPALLGGLTLLAVAGLVARLLDPRWAPAAAAVVGLTQPVLLTARSTYSEPLAQLLLLAALCLLLDAVGGGHRRLAALAGLLVGIGLLVRIDALREIALLVPVAAWLALRRHRCWLPLTLGVLAGAAYGAVDALGPARPYVADLMMSVRPALAAVAGLALLAVVAVPAGRRLAPWLVSRRWWPRLRTGAAALAALGVAGLLAWLALRPLVWSGRGTAAAWRFIEGLQREQGLPVDGQRNYAEQAVRWTSWYVGWPALGLAAAAAVLLTWRAVRGNAAGARWALGLGVPLASALSVLGNPAITPDHPWADRRLVPTVLPVVTLLALWAVAELARAVRAAGPATLAGPATTAGDDPGDRPGPAGTAHQNGHRAGWLSPAAARWAATGVVAAGLLALLLPAEAGSRALRGTRTEAGQPAAVERACAAFAPGDVALLVDARSRQEWTAVLREACAVPAFGVPGVATDRSATRGEAAAAVARVRTAGRRPVLVAQSSQPLPRLTDAPQRQVVDLDTWEHHRLISGPPRELQPLSVELWLATPDAP